MNEISVNKQSMTLKEITDLLSVEHNKAMKIVGKWLKSPNLA